MNPTVVRAYLQFCLSALLGAVVTATCAAGQSAGQTDSAKPHPGVPAGAPASPQAAAPRLHASTPNALSASYTISQLGHAVGDAEYHFVRANAGIDSTSTVRVTMQGLDYALSKTERLDAARQIIHEQLSATVNGSAVNVTGKPDAAQFLLNISANGRSTTTRLAAHNGAVFLPDFDAGAWQTLLKFAAAQNNRDLWAISPKNTGLVEPVQLATLPDEHGTLDGKAVIVHHLVATIAGAETDLFAGPDNQLLQAELAQQGFSLVRTGFVLTPPRRPVSPDIPPRSQPQS